MPIVSASVYAPCGVLAVPFSLETAYVVLQFPYEATVSGFRHSFLRVVAQKFILEKFLLRG